MSAYRGAYQYQIATLTIQDDIHLKSRVPLFTDIVHKNRMKYVI